MVSTSSSTVVHRCLPSSTAIIHRRVPLSTVVRRRPPSPIPMESIRLKDNPNAHAKLRIHWTYIAIVRDIINNEAIQGRRERWLRRGVFAEWLFVLNETIDGVLIHQLLMRQAPENPDPEFDGIRYELMPDEFYRLGPREFCLITGLRFGKNKEIKGEYEFLEKLKAPPYNIGKSLTLKDLVAFVKRWNENRLMVEDDIFRLCLLVLLYSLFMGVEPTKSIEEKHFVLVDNFKEWDNYYWGSYIWSLTYPKLLNKLDTATGKNYTITGFAWIAKWFVFESFPSLFRTYKLLDKTPRVIGWKDSSKRQSGNAERVFNVGRVREDFPIQIMPTVDEASSDWFVSSARYINSEAKKNLTARTMNQAQTAEFKNDINLQQKYVNQFVGTNPEEENTKFGEGSSHGNVPSQNMVTLSMEQFQQLVEKMDMLARENKTYHKCYQKYLQDCIDPFIEKSSKLFNEPGSSHENLNHIYLTPQQPQMDASRDPSSAQVNNSPEPSVQIIQKSERLGRGKRVKKKSRVMESPFVCHPVGGKQKYVWSLEAADKLMNTEDLWHYSTVNPRFAFTDIFWSRLLGQSMDGWLTNEHILTWTRVLLERKPDDERWTILAPDLLDNVMSNGSWNHKSAKPPYPNINDADLFYLPVNIPGQHWFLVCIDIINWSMFIYDSLPDVYLDESNMRLTKLDNYFPQWLIKNKYRLLTTYRDPPFQRVMVLATRQSVRLGDCGVWVCINLERLTVGVDLIQEEDAGQAAMEWRENFAKHCYENTYRVLHEGSNDKRPKEVFPET